MSARDELAKVIVSHPWLQDFEGLYTGRCPECGRKIHGGSNSPSHANHLAEAVLAAGYRKPRTITDHYAKDGTHALKVGSVILSHGEALLAMSGGVFADPTDSTWDYWELELPITVIYEPEDGPTLDASHSNPRIIKTPEELDILPVGAVVLSEPYTHHENGYSYQDGMEFEIEDYATAEEADSDDGYGYYLGRNNGGLSNVEVREDHVELVKSRAEMDARTIPTLAELAKHLGSEALGFGDDIELDEADYSAKDGTFEVYGTKDGLRFAARVQVLEVERTDF